MRVNDRKGEFSHASIVVDSQSVYQLGQYEVLQGAGGVNCQGKKKAHLGEVDFFSFVPQTGGWPVQDNLIIGHKTESCIGIGLEVA